MRKLKTIESTSDQKLYWENLKKNKNRISY